MGTEVTFRSAAGAEKRVVTESFKPLIAIVDDDESVCRAVKRLVRSRGYHKAVAPAAQAGYESPPVLSSLKILPPEPLAQREKFIF